MSFGLVQDTVAAITALSLSVIKAGREFIAIGSSSCSFSNNNNAQRAMCPWLTQVDPQNQSSKMNPFVDLPVEVLTRILTYLDAKDISSISRVCKSFYEVSQIETIWMHRCSQDFKIPIVPNCGFLYRDLYTGVLYKYGNLIGLWQCKVKSYGGLLKVYYEEGKLFGVEFMPPMDPNLKDPLRKRTRFVIQLGDTSTSAIQLGDTSTSAIQLGDTNTVSTLCVGGHFTSHSAEIDCKPEKMGSFRFKCCATGNHEHPEGRSRGLMQWLEEECGTPLDLQRYTHSQELLLMKFLVLCQYNHEYSYHRLSKPMNCANVPIQPGLFKGTYGAHGLEIIMLQYVQSDNVTKAIAEKMTGDPNVPAGEITFHVNLENGIILTKEQQASISTLEEAGLPHVPYSSDTNLAQPFRLPADCLERFHDIPKFCTSRFYGHGQIAGHGFANPSFCVGHWIIFNEDLFGFLWLDLLSLSIFHRVQEDLRS